MTTQLDVSAQHSEPHLPVVFFDGGCPLCRREIAHYRRIDTAQRLCWVDAASEPEALQRHGVSMAGEDYHYPRFAPSTGIRLPPFRSMAQPASMRGPRLRSQ